MAWGANFTPPVPLFPQLWYFWRRRLFIWISFVDSYFELLLYVGLPSPPLSQALERQKGSRLA